MKHIIILILAIVSLSHSTTMGMHPLGPIDKTPLSVQEKLRREKCAEYFKDLCATTTQQSFDTMFDRMTSDNDVRVDTDLMFALAFYRQMVRSNLPKN